MANLIRGLDSVLADLDTRQRQGNPSKNRPLQKYQSISDSVTITDTQTVTTYTPPFQFALQSYRRAVLADAPVSYWRLGEMAPAVTANDERNANYGTYTNGPQLGYGAAGNSEADRSAYFPGTTQYVESTTGLQSTGIQAFSVELWMNPDTVDAKFRIPIGTLRTDGLGLQGWDINFQSGPQFAFERYNNGAADFCNAATSAFAGVWQHVVATYDGNAMNLWRNGSKIAGPTVAARQIQATTGTLRIGKGTNDAGTTASNYAGYIDEVAIYSVALTSSQVANHYSAMITPAATGTSAVVGMSQFS